MYLGGGLQLSSNYLAQSSTVTQLSIVIISDGGTREGRKMGLKFNKFWISNIDDTLDTDVLIFAFK